MNLLILALAPVFFILIYIYLRDKYEREPIRMLLLAFFVGMLSVIPILPVEMFINGFSESFHPQLKAFYDAFFVAGFSEELFKYLAFMLIIWRNKNFDEYFDGIVYAVFISLGFAAVENVLYVFQNGVSTGIMRAITSVPGHALFGVAMGYYLSLSRFNLEQKKLNRVLALLIPILLHGFYDWILMTGIAALLLVFIAYLVYLWKMGFKKLKILSEQSQFKN